MLRQSLFLLALFLPFNLFAAEKPNVILVMCDDLGWGDLTAFNPETPIKTPHLSEMAAAGLKFNRFYAAAPVCSPTRGSCLTGRHPYRYGIYFANTGHLKSKEITLPEILKKEGYTTGHFGKWHLGTLTTTIKDANRGGPKGKKNFSTPQMNGYDRCFVTESKVPTYDPLIKPKAGGKNGWDYLKNPAEGVSYGTHYWDENGEVVKENLSGDDSRVIMDRAIPFIEEAAKEKTPFFAAIWFHSPHLPVVAGPEHVKHYSEHSEYDRNYYGCITALDEQIGRLRKRLKELDVAENTMLWFCSDNGPEGQTGKAPGSAGPFRGRKRSLYEGGVRVPGLLEWPGHVQAGTETNLPAVTSDYLPTVLAVIGIDYPGNRPIDGINLLPAIQQRTSSRKSPIGFQSGKMKSWVTDQYKLFSPDQGKTWELYDLIKDPVEQTDLAAMQPELVQSMKSELEDWIRSCSASDKGKDY
ncbi:MAG: sulfatase-like hydrolase/transferase [Planctomicrobium sp.]|jgi:arylsulfatase A-like enzyme|nr:sulfatase-like hydrolase/transferase [Planctomicrobium sp.]